MVIHETGQANSGGIMNGRDGVGGKYTLDGMLWIGRLLLVKS